MLNRLAPPPTRPLGRVDLPLAQVSHLRNGARLHVLANHAQPVVRLQVILPAGRWYDAAPGTSLLTARTLLEGTTNRSARQIADEVAQYGASLECEQGFDRATLTLYCLTRHFIKLLPLVQDVLANASFPAAEVEQVKTRSIQNIRVERQKTSYQAAERFSQNLYGSNHPYGVMFDEARFQGLTPDAVQDYYRQHYQLSNSDILLCGDVTDSHITELSKLLDVESLVTAATLVSTTTQPTPLKTQDYVEVPGSLQASLRLGRLWPSAGHSDTHKLQVLVKILGGYFGSRLMKNIREEKGLTYGIYASISHREHASSCVIGSDVNATNARLAVNEIHHELIRLQEEPVPNDELETVRNYILGKFLNELGTVFEQADKYRTIISLGLPLTFYQDFLSEVNAVTAQDLQDLAQQHLTPSSFIEVVAGP